MTDQSSPQTLETVRWEAFVDRSYFEMCAVRPTECRDFGMSFHVPSMIEATFLAELLNELPGSAQAFIDKYRKANP